MKVYVKREIVVDGAVPIKLLQQIEETKKRIEELEAGERITEERYQRFAGEAGWLRRELASGDLILKDIAKIDTTESDAKLCQQALRRIEKDLKKARVELTRMIETFNKTWIAIDTHEEIR